MLRNQMKNGQMNEKRWSVLIPSKKFFHLRSECIVGHRVAAECSAGLDHC